jgi:hypothetical protein
LKVPASPTDGTQPLEYVLGQLRYFGVEVVELGDSQFELTDSDGDPEVLFLDDPVTARMVVHLWRRFGQLHGMLPGDFVKPSEKKKIKEGNTGS